MKSKKQPGKQVLDITRPKKKTSTEAPPAPQLLIPKRSIMVPVSEAKTEAEPSAPIPITTKQEAKNLRPETAPEIAPTTTPIPKPMEPPTASTPQPPASPPTASQPRAQRPPEDSMDAQDKPEPTAAEDLEPENTDTPETKADPEVRKALEEAKREQELQGFLDDREFFVPINAVARKRSLKVSIGLTIVELLLGVILLNLMLDAGLIHLLEKIPHTNFFNLQ